MFLQSMFIVAPILYLLTPWISSKREQIFPNHPTPNVTLGWIYTAIGSVAVVLLLFIIGAKVLGTTGLEQQVSTFKAGLGQKFVHTNESIEMISWISIGLVLILGSGSVYLVGTWNKNLQEKVDRKTEELTQSQKALHDAVDDRDMLLNSIHDRIRNNLTMVLALLELQLKGEKEKSNEEILKDSHSRIRSMALIHETMVQSESLDEVNIKRFAIKLSNRIQKSFQNKEQEIEVSMNVNDIMVHIDQAVPLAMILNELMVNAFMHGFVDLKKGVVFVSLHKNSENLVLEVRDNGKPLPSDFDEKTKHTLGFKLIKTLVRQLQGTYKVMDKEDPYFQVSVPTTMLVSNGE